MKFDCGLSREETRAEQAQWHKWFAWYPVRVGHRNCRWLEVVERKKIYRSYGYDTYTIRYYREVSQSYD